MMVLLSRVNEFNTSSVALSCEERFTSAAQAVSGLFFRLTAYAFSPFSILAG
jgi:hypothetical protein